MAGWTSSAKWAARLALDGQSAVPFAPHLSERLGVAEFAADMLSNL